MSQQGPDIGPEVLAAYMRGVDPGELEERLQANPDLVARIEDDRAHPERLRRVERPPTAPTMKVEAPASLVDALEVTCNELDATWMMLIQMREALSGSGESIGYQPPPRTVGALARYNAQVAANVANLAAEVKEQIGNLGPSIIDPGTDEKTGDYNDLPPFPEARYANVLGQNFVPSGEGKRHSTHLLPRFDAEEDVLWKGVPEDFDEAIELWKQGTLHVSKLVARHGIGLVERYAREHRINEVTTARFREMNAELLEIRRRLVEEEGARLARQVADEVDVSLEIPVQDRAQEVADVLRSYRESKRPRGEEDEGPSPELQAAVHEAVMSHLPPDIRKAVQDHLDESLDVTSLTAEEAVAAVEDAAAALDNTISFDPPSDVTTEVWSAHELEIHAREALTDPQRMEPVVSGPHGTNLSEVAERRSTRQV